MCDGFMAQVNEEGMMTSRQDETDQCGLYAVYVAGHCVLEKGHEPAADHLSQYGVHFTRGLTKEEGGHE